MTNPTNDTPDDQLSASDSGTDTGETVTADSEPVTPTAAAPPIGEPVMATSAATQVSTTREGKRPTDRPKRGPVRPEGPAPLGHFAVVETGGKQYRVSVGDRIAVERLEGDAGSEVMLDRVLMVGGDGAPQIGAPLLDGVAVRATIETQYRGEKIVIFKMKPKKRYRRRTGHRQSLTRLAITAINA